MIDCQFIMEIDDDIHKDAASNATSQSLIKHVFIVVDDEKFNVDFLYVILYDTMW